MDHKKPEGTEEAEKTFDVIIFDSFIPKQEIINKGDV